MTHGLDLPMCLWKEVFSCAVYILNKCLHCVLKNKTPKQAFTGEKPDVSYFQVFGTVLHQHTSIRLVTSLVSYFAWSLYQMDVKTAFLNVRRQEEVYNN
jgi:hypothetical protein